MSAEILQTKTSTQVLLKMAFKIVLVASFLNTFDSLLDI